MNLVGTFETQFKGLCGPVSIKREVTTGTELGRGGQVTVHEASIATYSSPDTGGRPLRQSTGRRVIRIPRLESPLYGTFTLVEKYEGRIQQEQQILTDIYTTATQEGEFPLFPRFMEEPL